MDRICILLWYSHGHLLLECLECERTRSSTGILPHVGAFTVVACFPDVIDVSVLLEWVDLRPGGRVRFYGAAQRDSLGRGRSSCPYRLVLRLLRGRSPHNDVPLLLGSNAWTNLVANLAVRPRQWSRHQVLSMNERI